MTWDARKKHLEQRRAAAADAELERLTAPPAPAAPAPAAAPVAAAKPVAPAPGKK